MSVTKLSMPVGDELDRPLEQLRQRDRRHLVGIGVHLDAERAADILGDDAHLLLFQSRDAWRTGSASCAAPACRDRRSGAARRRSSRRRSRAARCRRRCGGRTRRSSRPRRRRRRRPCRLAGVEHALEAEIVAELRMDHRRAGIERGFRIGDGRQFLVVDLDQFAGVLGLARACARPRRRPLRPASRRGRRRWRIAAPT